MPKAKKTKTANKRPSKSRNAKSKKTQSHRSWLSGGFLLKLGLVLVTLLLALLILLDATVTSKFEGRRWALPAKVYARPLELFPGKVLSSENLQYELELLGYARSDKVSRPGQYSRSWNGISIYTREFKLWDELLPAQRITLTLSGGRIRDMSDHSGAALDLVALEPMHIGGIFPAHNEDRSLVRIDEVPRFIRDSLIAVEDQGFYQHHGISPTGIARAFWANMKAGRLVQGGSTLTQQLVKNFYLTSDRNLWRKATEALMALLLDFHYDKDEILEAYLNEIYLGQARQRAIHGFGLASQFYFGRSLRELKLHQVALLVAIVKGPSYYNPRRHPERALARRDLVLDILARENVVAADKAGWAKRQPLDVINKPNWSTAAYPAYMDLVKRQLRKDYKSEDLTSEGLQIFTTFDPIVQRDAERALIEGVENLVARHGEPVESLEGSVIVTSTDTSEVLALVGGKDTKYSGFNRGLDAVRPVGSLLKPAVYLSALSDPERFNLATFVDDSPVEITLDDENVWAPKNFDETSHGQVPLHQALANSYNQATARLGMEIGLDAVIASLQNLGIERDIPKYPSIMLGSLSLSPLEVAAMYQTIAAGGFDSPLRAIREVMDAEGQLLNRYPLNVEQRFAPELIHLIYYALQGAMREGTGKLAYRSLPEALNIAGKTGSTDDLRDSWFAGFTGDRLSVVWLGNDDNSPTQLTGSAGALKVWVTLMQRLNPQPFRGFVPDNIEYLWVDDETGLASAEGCTGARYMPFVLGSGPQEKAPCVKRGGQISEWIKSWFQ